MYLQQRRPAVPAHGNICTSQRASEIFQMWSQYADNHAGACLVYDRTQLEAQLTKARIPPIKRVYCDPVEYRNPPPVPVLGRPSALTFSVLKAAGVGIEAAVDQHIDAHRHE